MRLQKRSDYDAVLKEIAGRVGRLAPTGAVADYIPALARVNPDQYAVCVQTLEGGTCTAGAADTRFSIQSISKVFATAMVIAKKDILLWSRVGVEPSGNAFNSLVQLEYEHGIPRNPLINAGAIVVSDELLELYEDPKKTLLHFVRELAGDESVDYDTEVADSEYATASTNRALAYYLKSHGNLRNDVEAVLDLYCHQCALALSTKALARALLFQANDGIIPSSRRRILTEDQSKRLNSIMLTCGFYDQAGEFAYQVGLPGKSGVGGGIVAVVPDVLSIAVWSPRLNEHGNSVLGIESLQQFTSLTGLAIF